MAVLKAQPLQPKTRATMEAAVIRIRGERRGEAGVVFGFGFFGRKADGTADRFAPPSWYYGRSFRERSRVFER